MRIVCRKDVYIEIMKSLFNPGDHPRGSGGKFIHKFSPDTGLNGGVSSSKDENYVEMDCDVYDSGKNTYITKKLLVREDIADLYNQGKIFYKFPAYTSKTTKRNFAAKVLCNLITETEIKEPDKPIKNADAYVRVQMQKVQNAFSYPERGKCKALNDRKVKVEYMTSTKHITNKASENEKFLRGKAVKFIPEIIEQEGVRVGSELVEYPKGYASLRHDIVGKCFIDNSEWWVSVILVDEPKDTLHLTIFTEEIHKSLRHDTSVGIIGDFSTGRESLKSISQSSNVNGIDNLSKSITLGRVID